MEKLGLIDHIESRFKKDFAENKEVSQCTEKEVVNMIRDFDLSDIKMMDILRRMKEIFESGKATLAGIVHFNSLNI